MEPIAFASAADLRAWLEQHHRDRDELWIEFRKASGKQHDALRYSDAVDEALCFGWIDGVRKSKDADRYVMRFTPRKPRSIWSRVNLAKVETLIAAGRMTPAGMAAFESRTADRMNVYSFENDARELDPARAEKLAANRRAHAFFEAQPPSYRRTASFWVMSAKKDETRDRRLEELIASSARHELAPPFRWGSAKPKVPGAASARAAKPPKGAAGRSTHGAAGARSAAKKNTKR